MFKQQTVVFRVDVQPVIGSGHLIRCLTLASALKETGAHCIFICSLLPDKFAGQILNAGFELRLIPAVLEPFQKDAIGPDLREAWIADSESTISEIHNAILNATIPTEKIDWLIVDHYSIDARWERKLRSHVGHIFVIDDLVDRSHDCDILLDQNFISGSMQSHTDPALQNTMQLLGPRFALLREEFREAKKLSSRPRETLLKALIFFGASDLTNETEKVLKAFSDDAFSELQLTVVFGEMNTRSESLASMYGHRKNWRFMKTSAEMAKLMAEADFSIGAGGTTAWERCFLNLPTIITQVAENQRQLSLSLAAQGAALDLGWHSNVSPEDYARAARKLMSENLLATKMSKACERIFHQESDTVGAVVRAIKNFDTDLSAR
ncbi:MAG: UDP-2,4-diacetamido-2,4,6-trideoxy-beta-L-altropyranose hydrolase [Bdellovibrionota bacterium]